MAGTKQTSTAIGGRRKFLVSYVIVGISFALFALRPLVLVPIITRQMGKEAYGVWAQVMVTFLFLAPILTMKFMSALSRFLAGSKSDRDISRCYIFSVLATICVSATAFAAAAVFPRALAKFIFGEANLTAYVWPAFLFACTGAMFMLMMSYYYTTGRQITYAVFRSLLIVGQCTIFILISRFAGIVTCINWLSAWQMLLSAVILVRIITRHGWARPSVAGVSGFWKFAAWLILIEWVFFAAGKGGRYIIVGLMGLELVAVYQVTFTVAGILSLIAAPSQFVLMPMLCGHWNTGRREQIPPLVRLNYMVLVLLGLPIMAALLQTGEYLIEVLSSKDYFTSPGLLLCLASWCLLSGFFQVANIAFRLTRKFLKLLIIIIIGSVINIGLSFILIPRLGLTGAGIATLLSMVFMTVCAYRYGVGVFGAGLDWIRTGKAVILGLMVYLALMPVRWMPGGSLTKLLLSAGIMMVVSVLGFFVLRFYSMDQMRSIVKKFRKSPGETGAVPPMEIG